MTALLLLLRAYGIGAVPGTRQAVGRCTSESAFATPKSHTRISPSHGGADNKIFLVDRSRCSTRSPCRCTIACKCSQR